jgi:two-component system sensor histidine kinase RegB
MSGQILSIWFFKLRWFAFVGQILVLAIAVFYLKLSINWKAISTLLSLIPISNLLMGSKYFKNYSSVNNTGIVLLLDTLILTGILYYSGGPSNPFTIVYFLHVVLAAILLNNYWLWLITFLCSSCFASLFFKSVEIHELGHHAHHSGLTLHLYGMLFAFVLVAFLSAYFLNKINRELNNQAKKLLRLENAAINQQKLAILASITANAAHELNTPLGTISIIAKELEKSSLCKSNADLSDDIKILTSESKRCKEILNNLSEKTGDQLGETLQSIKLDDLINLAIKNISSDKITVTGDLDSVIENIPIKAITQSLKALTQNAIEANSKTIQIKCTRNNKGYNLRISDDGEGISLENIDRIGEPFFTTKFGQGMGLGVYLCKLAVEQLGGSLNITSKPSKGTIIDFFIPQ